MSDHPIESSETEYGSSTSLLGLFIKSLVRPSVHTYKDVLNDSVYSKRTLLLWFFIFSWVGLSLGFFVNFASRGIFRVTYLCVSPISGVIGLFSLAVYSGISHFISRMLGGDAAFNSLFYSFGAFLSPLLIVSGAIMALSSYIPFLGYVSILVWLYAIYPASIAVKAVYQFDNRKALIPGTIVFCGMLILDLLV